MDSSVSTNGKKVGRRGKAAAERKQDAAGGSEAKEAREVEVTPQAGGTEDALSDWNRKLSALVTTERDRLLVATRAAQDFVVARTSPLGDFARRVLSTAERRVARRLRSTAAQLGRVAYRLEAAAQRLDTQRGSSASPQGQRAAAGQALDDELCAPHLA
jgi:hypothetical protein